MKAVKKKENSQEKRPPLTPEERRVRRVRCIIIGCLMVCGYFCYAVLLGKYDPLARYPYGSAEQRKVMLHYLDDREVDYLINAQIQPDTILPFLGQNGFIIENSLYYDAALKARNAEPEAIVEFVNRYRNRFDLQSLPRLLSWMSYGDLIRYFDSGSSLPLVDSPEDEMLILDGSRTVFLYQPSDLQTTQDGIVLRRSAAEAWNAMCTAAAADGIQLQAQSGYIPYGQQNQDETGPGYVQGPYGTREEQLGLTVRVTGFDLWNAQPYPSLEILSEDQKNTAFWLRDNAWKYGWVFRQDAFGNSAEEVWNPRQPFLLRYAGLPRAEQMHAENRTFEQQAAAEKEKRNTGSDLSEPEQNNPAQDAQSDAQGG